MKKVLIIGGAGFIGFHLAKELLQYDYKIVLADNFSRGVNDFELKKLSENTNVFIVNLNILDEIDEELIDNNFDYIYHFAAIIGVDNVLNNPSRVLLDNMHMLNNAVKLSKRQNNLKRFVFTSTSEVYAGTLKYFKMEIPTPEETPLTVLNLEHSRTSYMLSKIYGEAVLNQSQLDYVIVRPHNIYGPRMGMSHIIPQQLSKVFSSNINDSLEVYNPRHKRTFCYVTDAVKMIHELAINQKSNKGTFNIGNQEPEVTIKNVIDIILEVCDKDLKINAIDLNNESPVRRCPEMSKTFSVIGKKNTINLKQGIEMTYEWYKENVFKNKSREFLMNLKYEK